MLNVIYVHVRCAVVTMHAICEGVMSVETLGKDLVQTLCDSLWHITSHYKYFSDCACPIQDLLSSFKDLNNYQSQKKAKPKLSYETLKQFVDKLA